MPRGSKASYTAKQKRQAAHIEEGYKKEGASTKKAERIAWATVNKTYGKAGTNKPKTKASMRKGGHNSHANR